MRPLTFNKQQALADVTQLFWKQGYEGTSVQQILSCMGLNRSSLYSTFGDKRALFVQALAQFSTLSRMAGMSIIQIAEPKEAVRQFFNLAFFSLPLEQRSYGCLLVNTILEQSGLDDELASVAAATLIDIEASFQQCFELAKTDGRLSEHSDPKVLASFFMTLNKGMRVAAREGRDEVLLREMVEASLIILD